MSLSCNDPEFCRIDIDFKEFKLSDPTFHFILSFFPCARVATGLHIKSVFDFWRDICKNERDRALKIVTISPNSGCMVNLVLQLIYKTLYYIKNKFPS